MANISISITQRQFNISKPKAIIYCLYTFLTQQSILHTVTLCIFLNAHYIIIHKYLPAPPLVGLYFPYFFDIRLNQCHLLWHWNMRINVYYLWTELLKAS